MVIEKILKLFSGNLDHGSLTKKGSAFTIIEIVFSVTLLAIISLGTAQYMVFSRWDIDRGIRRQLAWITMSSRMEQAIDFGENNLQDSLAETSTPITVNNIQAYRTTVVTGIDDPTDGLSPTDTEIPDYSQVQIYISWFTADNISDSVTTFISKNTGWNYEG
ncbi:hypothetical protein HQ531_07875 [bacterium]|nr:hypothetical protein [bacterium]